MSALMRVAVVRPKRTAGEWAAYLLMGIGLTFLVGWQLMLIAGAVTDWGLSYWDAVLGLVALRLVQNSSGWTNWTHPSGGTR